MKNRFFKNLLSGFVLAFLSILPGIIPAEAQKAKKLKIELGETFKYDQVKIYLDKKLVYDNRVSTVDSAGLADLFYVNKPKTPYTITVEINGSKFEKSTPKKKKELDDEDYSILINYNREAGEIDVKTKTLIILYD
jgi:hypothetical protein